VAHTLAREVRFWIDPLAADMRRGNNSYSGIPDIEGLGLFLSLWVALTGKLEEKTAFVMNVVDIDKIVRENIVGIFSQFISGRFAAGRAVYISQLCAMLQRAWKVLEGCLDSRIEVVSLRLQLSPFRSITIESGDSKMFYFAEKFEFCATHKLWNEQFTPEKNVELFGKCANKAGHGHNYIVEVTVEAQTEDCFCIGEYERIVKQEFVNILDHKNLNVDVDYFKKHNPTVENIAKFGFQQLKGKFADNIRLSKVTVWESDRMYCSYIE